LLPESERRDAYRECDRLLTVKDVAKQLGVCSATVYRLCDRGELPYLRIVDSIRILPLDLVAYRTRARS
jgi:excisionase family DNA binding protein